ncbi:MAG: hypothetical protein E7604_01810 [Ruminococcaceae bacterium]|nr:hypothetical protein [Oscillospiraceae bacterium]
MAKQKLDKLSKILIGVCAVLLVAVVICGVMTFEEKNRFDNTVTNLARSSAHYAAESFRNFNDGGEDYLYTAAVADYNNMLCLFYQVQGEKMHSEFLVMNEVYGHLIMQPELAKTWIPLLAHGLDILADDLTNAHAHEELITIRNALVEERAATEEDLTHSHDHEH